MSDETLVDFVVGAGLLAMNIIGAAMGGRHSKTLAAALKAITLGICAGLIVSLLIDAWIMFGRPYNIKLIWVGPVLGTFIAWIVAHRFAIRERQGIEQGVAVNSR